MLSKKEIHQIKSLKDSKARKNTQLFIAEGPKTVLELANGDFIPESIYCTEEQMDNLKAGLPVEIDLIAISKKDLERISQLKTPNSVLGVFYVKNNPVPAYAKLNDLVFMLDGINDPGNLGTIIRTADWFGVKHVICSEQCVDVYNPKVIQSTMGSVASVEVHYTNLKRYLEGLPDHISCYGAMSEGSNMYKTALASAAILLIGSESHGIAKELHPFITHKVAIPGFSFRQNKAESLNASIAAAIICSEIRRQQS